MARRHSSFLVRCWDVGSDSKQRIEIEHIQSGAKVLARSIADATAWICAQSAEIPTRQETASDRLDSARDGAGKGGADG